MEPTYIIKFYYKDQEMKELEIPSDTMNMAVKIAIDTVGGYIPWDKIKVERR
jgi:hypothetical protein